MALTPTWPDYSAAPVVEVVVGLEFAPIQDFGIISLARAYDLWKPRFPQAVEREALPPTRPVRPTGGFELQFGQGVPPSRLWLVADNGRLIQVQRDRLLLNWRKTDAASSYPGHEGLLTEFGSLMQEFVGSDAAMGAELKPLVTEWTYVNLLEADRLLDGHALSVWSSPDLSIPSEPLSTSLQHVRRFHHKERDGQIEITAAPQPAGERPAALLTVSAKCFHRPDTSLQSAVDSATTAWEVARATFDASITELARREWGEGE